MTPPGWRGIFIAWPSVREWRGGARPSQAASDPVNMRSGCPAPWAWRILSCGWTLIPFLILTSLGAQTVSLNEIMTSNSGVVVDENGDSSDWLELFNPGTTPLDLNGYALTDDTNAPFKWVFTNTVLEAGQFLVVFCDGKDRSLLPVSPVDPASLPGLKVWLRADAVDTNDATQIRAGSGSLWLRKWVDQVGGDDNAQQGSD